MTDRNSSARNEDMFTSADNRSLRRGRRVAPRTEVCRPCLVWQEDSPESKLQGVVLDLNPHGMRIRMLEPIRIGELVTVQMMRDDEFQVPLSPPIRARVVRHIANTGGFVDHGVQVQVLPIKRNEARPVRVVAPSTSRHRRTRMHTLDITIGEGGVRRTGRNR